MPRRRSSKKSIAFLLWGVVICATFVACQKLVHVQSDALSHHQRAVPVMDTIFSVKLWSTDAAKAEMALDAVIGEVEKVDQLVNSYNSESELAFINAHAAKGPVELTPVMFEWIYFSLDLCKRTHGLLDVTLAPLIKLWGFHEPLKGETKEIPSSDQLSEIRKHIGYQKIDIDRRSKTIDLPAGMRIDLGATGKGFALDRAAAVLEDYEISSAEMRLGEQFYFYGNSPEGGRWKVSVRHPRDPVNSIVELEVEEGSVATSGDYTRFFIQGGKRYSHVLDPRNGWPVRDMASVTVWAPSGIEADAWSTALFVAGPDHGKKILESEKPLTAVWVRTNEKDEVKSDQIEIREASHARVRKEKQGQQ